jgi:putative transposase
LEKYFTKRGLAAVGYTVKMLGEGKFIGIPATQESL